MDIRAKVIPKYWNQLKSGEKTSEFRQVDNYIAVNAETGEELVFPITRFEMMHKIEADMMAAKYSDINWQNKPMYKIELGKLVE